MQASQLRTAEPESRLLETLPIMRQLVERECSRRGLYGESDDLFSKLTVKLLDRDCAALKQFAARGDFRGFLMRIIQRLVVDHRRRQWGKWRPAASARRAGPAALLLDRLTSRDGFSRAEAIQITAETFGLTSNAVEEVDRAIKPALRRRVMRSMPPLETAFTSAVEIEETNRELQALRRALSATLVELSADDRVLIQQRYVHDTSITAIADARGIDRKLLYRRFARIHTTLRQRLIALGMDRTHVLRLLDEGLPHALECGGH